jgi:aspartate carbamoyltransferase catalytic subunit
MSNQVGELQLNSNQQLRHLLSLEGLPQDTLLQILDTAKQFVSVTNPDREVKRIPCYVAKVFLTFF